MATIVVFGAGGRIGSRIVIEAAERSHQITAVTRDGAARDLPGHTAARGDATSRDSVAALALDAEVFVSAVGGPDKTVYLRAARNLIETLAGLDAERPRIIHSGAGGSLLNANNVRFADTPEFAAGPLPAAEPTAQEFLAESLGQAAALDYYRTTTASRGPTSRRRPVTSRPA